MDYAFHIDDAKAHYERKRSARIRRSRKKKKKSGR
jgi:hypothetical protein